MKNEIFFERMWYNLPVWEGLQSLPSFPGGSAVTNPPAKQESQETPVLQSLDWENPLEEEISRTRLSPTLPQGQEVGHLPSNPHAAGCTISLSNIRSLSQESANVIFNGSKRVLQT